MSPGEQLKRLVQFTVFFLVLDAAISLFVWSYVKPSVALYIGLFACGGIVQSIGIVMILKEGGYDQAE